MASDYITLPESRVPIVARPDVLVCGGGSAGLSAAIAAARNGADTLLIERFSYTGGLATGGLIILLLTMDDGAGKQVIGGLQIVSAWHATPSTTTEEWNDPDPKLVRHYSWGFRLGQRPHRVHSVAFEKVHLRRRRHARRGRRRILYQTWACDLCRGGLTHRCLVGQSRTR
jgi:glycine/D-amino acid oxidase-like deaminating enzyme